MKKKALKEDIDESKVILINSVVESESGLVVFKRVESESESVIFKRS